MNGNKKSMGLGGRGYLLTIYTFIGFLVWMAFSNYPNNVMAGAYAESYSWNAALVSTFYTASQIISVVIQLFISKKYANGNVKKITMIFAVLALVCGVIMSLLTSQPIFLLFYVLAFVFADLWSKLGNGVLVGQWFPTRKGTVMGLSTFAFPIGTGVLLSLFASIFAKRGAFAGFSWIFILGVVGILILAFALSNYPEEVGCYRDNDHSMTKEKAEEMMNQEMAAKQKSVWTIKACLTSRDFWFIVIPEAAILFASVGFMVQIISVFNMVDAEFYAQYGAGVMTMISVVACLGSWVLGVIDTKRGTKFSILLTSIIMLLASICGAAGALLNQIPFIVVAAVLLALFMGASSNYTVSGAAAYWRREDFPSVFGYTNPIANLLSAPGTALIAIVAAAAGVHMSFIMVAVLSVAAIILISLFSPKHLKEKDNELRKKAGLPVD